LVCVIWSMVFGSRYWPQVFGSRYWPHVLGPRYWSYVVLNHGIERGINLYKEKTIIRSKHKYVSGEYFMKCEIDYAGYGYVMLSEGCTNVLNEGWWTGIMKTKAHYHYMVWSWIVQIWILTHVLSFISYVLGIS